jgi:asparagine synthase (glutamine-hydrolysing)
MYREYNFFRNINKLDFLDYMMANDYKLFMKDDILVKVDRATMSVSLEGREPLLDHKIIEFLARVPISIKYKNNCGKYLLKQILYKYIPPKILDRPKAGFQIPLNDWLRNDLKGLVDYYLDSRRLNRDIFYDRYVKKLKENFYESRNISVNSIWFIIVFQMWYERWM